MEHSLISWTDHTFNAWEGCSRVSPGCANCYAAARDARWHGGKAIHWGHGAPRRRTGEANWKKPVKWNRESWLCEGCGHAMSDHDYRSFKPRPCGSCGLSHRARVFCASLSDWLDDAVPIEWLADLLALIHATPNLDWQLLTKRPENFFSRLAAAIAYHNNASVGTNYKEWTWMNNWRNHGIAPANVWLGTSVENQAMADQRIPQLLAIPAAVRFLSCEPLLGSVKLTLPHTVMTGGYNSLLPYRPEGCTEPEQPRIHWVICGGESGPGARAMHPDWARSLRDQCAANGTAFFFKQWGEWAPAPIGEGPDLVTDAVFKRGPAFDGEVWRVGKKLAGCELDGIGHAAFPTTTPATPAV